MNLSMNVNAFLKKHPTVDDGGDELENGFFCITIWNISNHYCKLRVFIVDDIINVNIINNFL